MSKENELEQASKQSEPPHGYGHAEHVPFSSLPKKTREYLRKSWNALSPKEQQQHLVTTAAYAPVSE